MKKSAALFMIFLMILNICACKHVPEDTEGVSLPASSEEDKTGENNNGDLSPTPPVGQEDTAPEKPVEDEGKKTDEEMQEKPADKTDDKAPTDTPDTYQPNGNNAEPQEETDPQPEKDIPQTNVKGGPDTWVTITEEKSPPCDVTIDENFEEGEVMVMLMREQSAARQEYTAEDFPGVDVKEIKVILNYHSHINNNLGLKITLNKKDKQSVIDAVKILEQNPIVYSACPNYIFKIVY